MKPRGRARQLLSEISNLLLATILLYFLISCLNHDIAEPGDLVLTSLSTFLDSGDFSFETLVHFFYATLKERESPETRGELTDERRYQNLLIFMATSSWIYAPFSGTLR